MARPLELSPFPRNEFGEVLADKAATYWLAFTDLSGKLKAAQVELSDLKTGNDAMMLQIGLDAIDRLVGSSRRQANTDPIPHLRHIGESLRQARKMGLGGTQQYEAAMQSLAAYYATPLPDVLRVDWVTAFGTGPDDKARKKAEKKVADLEAQLASHKATAPLCMVDGMPPARFRNYVLRDPSDPAQVADHAHRIVGLFVADWKHRSRMFAVPTTVRGTAIQSLPDGQLEMHEAGWKLLGLQPSAGAPQFLAVDAESGKAYVSPKDRAAESQDHWWGGFRLAGR
ncbi:MAG: hypothetical protein KDA75_13135 [Planctomycetaceae bacterium]|nr:hypothetical protein [Planctomycetaceae bacterium]